MILRDAERLCLAGESFQAQASPASALAADGKSATLFSLLLAGACLAFSRHLLNSSCSFHRLRRCAANPTDMGLSNDVAFRASRWRGGQNRDAILLFKQ